MINEQNVSRVALNTWVTEASELGLAPGQWPRSIPTTLGNELDFLFAGFYGDEAHYQQNLGCTRLIVVND